MILKESGTVCTLAHLASSFFKADMVYFLLCIYQMATKEEAIVLIHPKYSLASFSRPKFHFIVFVLPVIDKHTSTTKTD